MALVDIPIGRITHFFEQTGFAVIDVMNQRLCAGDTIIIRTRNVGFRQVVTVVQIGHREVLSVDPGDTCVMKTDQPVEPGDIVYLESHHE